MQRFFGEPAFAAVHVAEVEEDAQACQVLAFEGLVNIFKQITFVMNDNGS